MSPSSIDFGSLVPTRANNMSKVNKKEDNIIALQIPSQIAS